MDRTTQDGLLNRRLQIRQPRRGHRTGHEALLLAAATAAKPGEHAVELGAGVGAASLALACRVPGLRLTLIEVDPGLAALAAENIRANGCGEQARSVVLDVAAPPSAYQAAGLGPRMAARVLMNPPFNDPVRHPSSPDAARALAHAGPAGGLAIWLRCASRLLAERGVLTLMWRADRLNTVLAALSQQFGATTVLPVHPRADAPASRVLIRAVKASRAPLCLLPGFVLADAEGRPTREADAVLRGQSTLALAH